MMGGGTVDRVETHERDNKTFAVAIYNSGFVEWDIATGRLPFLETDHTSLFFGSGVWLRDQKKNKIGAYSF